MANQNINNEKSIKFFIAGAAAHQWTTFKYSVCSPTLNPNCQYFPVKPVSHDKLNV